MNRFFKNLFGTKTTIRNARKSGFKPGFEALEDRRLLAVNIGLDPVNSQMLRITGDNAANIVSVVQNDETNTLDVYVYVYVGVPTPPTRYTSSSITGVSVDLFGGNDRFSYELADGTNLENAKSISVTGGSGDDQIELNFWNLGTSAIEADLTINVRDLTTYEIAGQRSRALAARSNKDVVLAVFGSIQDADLAVTANLGVDNDAVFAELRGDLVGASTANFLLQGDADLPFIERGTNQLGLARDGNDVFTVNAGIAEDSTASGDRWETNAGSEDSVLQIVMLGGGGGDSLNVLYNGEMDGQLILSLAGQASGNTASTQDFLFADVCLADDSDGSLNAVLDGGAGKDFLMFRLEDHADDAFQFLNRKVKGGTGALDTCLITANVATETCETVLFIEL